MFSITKREKIKSSRARRNSLMAEQGPILKVFYVEVIYDEVFEMMSAE